MSSQLITAQRVKHFENPSSDSQRRHTIWQTAMSNQNTIINGKNQNPPLKGQASEPADIGRPLEKSAELLDSATQSESVALQECQDNFKRLAADFSNYKKRTEAERLELADYLKDRMLTNVLEIYDDFIRLSDHPTVDNALAQGVQAVQRKWQQWLEAENVDTIAAPGDKFDPELHDAVLKQPVTMQELDGKIVHVVQSGYRRGERVLRHAKVVVGEYAVKNVTWPLA